MKVECEHSNLPVLLGQQLRGWLSSQQYLLHVSLLLLLSVCFDTKMNRDVSKGRQDDIFASMNLEENSHRGTQEHDGKTRYRNTQ